MPEVRFYAPEYDACDTVAYVVIAARYKGKWIFVKNRKRKAFEIPAGHIDVGEDAVNAAGRELYEETGALKFVYRCVNTYSVNNGNSVKLWGKLFLAEVSVIGDIVDRNEIEEILLSDIMPETESFPGVLSVLFERLRENIDYFDRV